MKKLVIGALLCALFLPGIAQAQDTEALAKKVQNPVASLISVPFQNNFNFGVGPDNDLQYNLNIQPVLPIKLDDDWNLISRTVLPLIYQPVIAPGVGDVFGLGDIQEQLIYPPARRVRSSGAPVLSFSFQARPMWLSARANGLPAPAGSRSS